MSNQPNPALSIEAFMALPLIDETLLHTRMQTYRDLLEDLCWELASLSYEARVAGFTVEQDDIHASIAMLITAQHPLYRRGAGSPYIPFGVQKR
jgi:hypothetical protein